MNQTQEEKKYLEKSIEIVIFTQSLAPGGAEKQAVLLGKALKEENFRVVFITFYNFKGDWKLSKDLDSRDIPIYRLTGSFIIKVVRFFLLLKKLKPDLLISYLLLPNILSGITGSLLKIRTFGGIRSSVLSKHKIHFYKLAHNCFTRLTIINSYCGKENLIRKGFSSEKFVVIPNAIKIGYKRHNSTYSKQINILSVGRFTPEKDYFTSLKAIKSLQLKGLSFKYTIIGWGTLLEKIKEFVLQLNISHFVEILIDPPNIEDYYLASDIFLQTSLFEGMSNTVLEAMSYSLPVISTNVGDNNRIVLHEKNGYLCEIGNHYDIADKLSILISDKEKRLIFGRNAFEHVSQNFDYNIFKKRYINLINGSLNYEEKNSSYRY